jgi:cobalt-precorrin 5A hydrolase
MLKNFHEKGVIAIWALTPQGVSLAERTAAGLPKVKLFVTAKLAELAPGAVCFDSLPEAVGRHFQTYDGHVFIMAAGIVMRVIAPHIRAKTTDPAVVAVDEGGRFAISLLSGHLGGANDLARRVAAVLGAQPVITTATDASGVASIDVLAREGGLYIENPQAIKTVNMALLTGKGIEVHDPFGVLAGRIPNALPFTPGAKSQAARVYVDDRVPGTPAGALVLRPRSLVAGIGCNRNTETSEIRELLLNALRESGLARESLKALASIDLKKDEQGLIALAEELAVPLELFGREDIGGVEDDVLSPSATVKKHIGVKSVCEAAAILAARGGALIVPKRMTRNATVALARLSFTSSASGPEDSNI